MSGRKWIALAASVALLAAAGAWWRLRPAPAEPAPTATAAAARPAPAAPTPAQLRELQAKAEAACLCARKLDGDPWNKGCWADFERSVDRWEHSEFATACLDESVAGVCFSPDDESPANERCVYRERPYRSCSEAEAVARRAEARAAGNRGCGGG